MALGSFAATRFLTRATISASLSGADVLQNGQTSPIPRRSEAIKQPLHTRLELRVLSQRRLHRHPAEQAGVALGELVS